MSVGNLAMLLDLIADKINVAITIKYASVENFVVMDTTPTLSHSRTVGIVFFRMPPILRRGSGMESCMSMRVEHIAWMLIVRGVKREQLADVDFSIQ
jgi:hypothetical protein